ncbi:MAG: AAA family ATPase, partial [Candidatus Eremiobacteraeota bacterium]|nr:AAA family ATPase [Candidatus Eremiobacteraeota bacterium]
MLGYLLVHAGESIGRIALANLLWPDEPEDVARTNLRRHLHEVTRALPRSERPWIAATMESISWPVRDDVWIDVAEFERAAADPARVGDAIELYRGTLLGDFYDEWLMVEQERLRATYLDLLVDAAYKARAEREFATALRYVDRILTEDEWREDAVRLGMAIKYESGDRTGALTDFSRFAAHLKKEMRVEPMADTLAMRDTILGNAPLESQRVDEEGAQAAGTPFVGRAEELESLRGAWSRAARGAGGTFFVGAPAGVGKSRLVAELAARVKAEGGRVLTGGTSNAEAFPYEAI